MPTLRHLAALALATLAGTAQADPAMTVVRQLSNPVSVSTVASSGAPEALGGALATAFFSDGTQQQALFVSGGSGTLSFASASGSRFVVVAEPGNDVSQPGNWFVTNLDTSTTLVGFQLDGRGLGAGIAAFDVSSFTSPASTPGSNNGSELLMQFSGRSFIQGLVTTTYSAPISLNGAGAVGDLFAVVRVDLAYTNAGLNGGLPPNSSLSSQNFRSDLDTVVYAAVPEPASALLLAAGAALLLGWRRRALRRSGIAP